jgi:RNA-directed DNA polymerase
MGRIGVEPQGNIIPRESGQTSIMVFRYERVCTTFPRRECKMTTQEVLCAGAPSHDEATWHGICWAKCHQEVRRLQARIVKATQEGRWGKVRALQWLLTHSFAAKALAVKRVTENQGKVTPGVDRVVWDTPVKKWNAIHHLKRQGYRPWPLRRIYIPKANGKLRPLGIPTMKDRAMQALYLLGLLPISETVADGCSYGFRPERAVADAIERCFIAFWPRPFIGRRGMDRGCIRRCISFGMRTTL